jgi:VanZ family protein
MRTEIRGRSPNSVAPRSELGLRPGTEVWAWICALAIVAQIFTLNALPFELGEPWDKLWHFLAYSALTLLLWIATDGRRPVLVVAAVMALGAADELRQALLPLRAADSLDLAADLLAVLLTGGTLLLLQGKRVCAESSPQ